MGQESASESVLVIWQDDSPEYKLALDSFTRGLDNTTLDKCRVLTCNTLIEQPGNLYFTDIKMCVIIGPKAADLAVNKVHRGIPIAYCMVYFPEKAGLMSDPENFGISLAVSINDQFDLITKVLPTAKTKATMATKTQMADMLWPIKDLQTISDMKYIVTPDEIENTDRSVYVGQLASSKADVIWTYPDSNVFHLLTMKMLLLEGIKKKVPVFGYSENIVKTGALMGVSVEPEKQGSRLAEMVNTVLAGTPLEQRHKTAEFKPVFNIAIAEIMRIDIPDDLLRQARYVYGM